MGTRLWQRCCVAVMLAGIVKKDEGEGGGGGRGSGGRTDVLHQPRRARIRRISRIQQPQHDTQGGSNHGTGHNNSIHCGASSSANLGFGTEVVFCFVEAEKDLAAAELDEVSAVVVAAAGGWWVLGGGCVTLHHSPASITQRGAQRLRQIV